MSDSEKLNAYNEAAEKAIPRLTFDLHKGQLGRICTIGGCKEYTGAPYFCAISALHLGADLSHVICSDAAAPIVKSYSPELMVHPYLDKKVDDSKQWIERCQVVIVGPGLGRGENKRNATELIEYCLGGGKPMVMDADAIQLIVEKPDLLTAAIKPAADSENHLSVILTPNIAEFSRLFHAQFPQDGKDKEVIKAPSQEDVLKVAQKLGGATICVKGKQDIISNGREVMLGDHPGSPRRCGGQGDLMSGVMGVFLHWFLFARGNGRFPKHLSPMMAAALAASRLTRECSSMAYLQHGRSTITTNLIEKIGPAVLKLWPTSG